MTDRGYLWLAELFYATSCALGIVRLRNRSAQPSLQRINAVVMICGVALHTAFLVARGNHNGRCPLTNSFETTVFITWAAALFYLLIGSSYRVSFLGEFTAPLVLTIGLVALLGISDVPRAEKLSTSPWVDLHAATAVLAYGAFALAFVTGGMYLVQERQLKSRHLSSSFLLLPSIEQLDVINFRLIVLGFGMLTVGMIGGMISYRIVGHWTTPKIVWAVGAWLLYGLVLVARRIWSLRGRKIALISMLSFAFVLVAFWGASLLSVVHQTPP